MKAMISADEFPLLKAFAIHIREYWYESDVVKKSERHTVASFRYLNAFPEYEPERISHRSEANAHSLNLVSLLRATYRSRKKSLVRRKKFPCSMSDNDQGTIEAECRILYTAGNSSGPKPDVTT